MVGASVSDYISLTKPRVVVLLQITAICSVIVHDVLGQGLGGGSVRNIAVVLVGG